MPHGFAINGEGHQETVVKMIARAVTRRIPAVLAGMLAGTLMVGGSWAATGSSGTSEPADPAPATESPVADGGPHGGTVERYHGMDCTLAAGLTGNWTHGDYVSAVARDGDDATEVRDAAKSRCGKPLVARKDSEKGKKSERTGAKGAKKANAAKEKGGRRSGP